MPRKAPEPPFHLSNLTPEQAVQKARKLLQGGAEGKKEITREIQEGLLAAMFIEREAGENPAFSGQYTEGNARQSRKQFKELAELVLDVVVDSPD